MSASNNFITKPVLSTVCSLLIVIVGLIAIPILPIENLPDIAPPTVKVQATYTGADAVAVEQGVTSVLEQQINGVENMDFITSDSSSDGDHLRGPGWFRHRNHAAVAGGGHRSPLSPEEPIPEPPSALACNSSKSHPQRRLFCL